jgi:hypothetical protein
MDWSEQDPTFFLTKNVWYSQCCASGSGMGKISRSGSRIRIRMSIPDHISDSLETIFLVKNTKFFDADVNLRCGIFLILDWIRDLGLG